MRSVLRLQRSYWQIPPWIMIAGQLVSSACGGTSGSNANPTAVPAQAQSSSAAPAESAAKSHTRPPVTPPTIASRVFVDVSTGMRGFASGTLRKAPLKTLHRLIDVTAGEAGADEAKRCALGSVVVCTKDLDGGVQCHSTPPINCYEKRKTMPDWSSAAVYSARSSKLDAALVPRPTPAQYDPDHPPPRDLVDETGLTVLVTGSILPDGVVASAGQSGATACRAGPSPQCVASALVDRAKDGYGIWLISVLLDYDGSYVADVPVDKRYLAAASEHLTSIKQIAPEASSKFAGVELKVGPQSSLAGDSAFSAFRYKGVRPLLLFVLSRDFAKGRRFVTQLAQRLRDDVTLRPGNMLPEDVVHTLELAPLTPDSYQTRAPQLGPNQGTLDPAALSEFRVGQTQSNAEGVSIDVQCGSKGKGWVLAPYAVIAGAAELSSPLTQTAFLRGPLVDRAAAPPKLGAFEPIAGQDAFRVFTSCAALGVREAAWSIEYGLRRRLALDSGAVAATWWAQLSAPNSYAMPERVYGLSSIALALLELPTTKDDAMGRFQLNVSRIE